MSKKIDMRERAAIFLHEDGDLKTPIWFSNFSRRDQKLLRGLISFNFLLRECFRRLTRKFYCLKKLFGMGRVKRSAHHGRW